MLSLSNWPTQALMNQWIKRFLHPQFLDYIADSHVKQTCNYMYGYNIHNGWIPLFQVNLFLFLPDYFRNYPIAKPVTKKLTCNIPSYWVRCVTKISFANFCTRIKCLVRLISYIFHARHADNDEWDTWQESGEVPGKWERIGGWTKWVQ